MDEQDGMIECDFCKGSGNWSYYENLIRRCSCGFYSDCKRNKENCKITTNYSGICTKCSGNGKISWIKDFFNPIKTRN